MSPWSRDGNQRMFLLRDRRWWQGWWWFRCLKPMLILLLEDCIVHQWSLRTSREFVQRQLWGIHAGRLPRKRDGIWWWLVWCQFIPTKKNHPKLLPKSGSKKWAEKFSTMKTQRTIFPIIQSTGKYHLATCNPRKSAWILPLGFHSKLELGLKGRVAFFFETCSCSF